MSRSARPRIGSADELERALVGVASGQAGAFEVVYAASRDRLHARALAVLRDHGLAEEVTQDALTEVWLHADRFDPARGSAIAWMTTIAHRRAVDRVRAVEAARRRDRTDADQRGALTSGIDVAELVGTRLEHEEIRRGLVVLTPLQLQALVFAFYGGHTYREVATLLDVPLSTVKARIRDGLLRLAQAVDRDEASHT